MKPRFGRWLAAATAALFTASTAVAAPGAPDCRGTLYLTVDTGWSREAEQIAATLRKLDIRATLFVADEPTFRGDRTLDSSWAPFWRARAAEGFTFASHTWRHWYFTGDPKSGAVRYDPRKSGAAATVLDQAALCAELRRPTDRLREMVPEAVVLPLWRAPGGRTTPNALAMARDCGLKHQGWTANGFLGDELDAARFPNRDLLRRNLDSIRDGEVLLLHWGVRSRQEPFAQVLEPLLAGLQAKGFCFRPLPAEGRG